jgi:phenylalanine-4-hydroxylase
VHIAGTSLFSPKKTARESRTMNTIVELDADHPGFKDPIYRTRRNHIASLEKEYHGTIETIPVVEYTPEEHGVWEFVFARLHAKVQKHAYVHHLRGLELLGLDPKKIPQLKELSKTLNKATGFRMVPVAGLVEPRLFLTKLGEGIFLSTQYIRHHSQPGFTPEPDIVHEVIGHAPQLIDPIIAAITREIGLAAQRANNEELQALERLYWFTIEYGLCREDGGLKAFGAGNLSSFIDIERCVSKEVEHRPFNLKEIISTSYDPTKPQPKLFIVDSFEEALKEIRSFCKTVGE